MLRPLNCSDMVEAPAPGWLNGFTEDFARRLCQLLSFRFRHFDPFLAYSLLTNAMGNASSAGDTTQLKPLNASHMWFSFVPADLKRLDAYSRQLVDHHLIMDLVPRVTQMYFMQQLPGVKLAPKQACVLVGLGLQHLTVEKLAGPLGIPVEQVMGLFKKAMRKMAKCLTGIQEGEVAATMAVDEAAGRATVAGMKPLSQSLDAELVSGGKVAEANLMKNSAALLKSMNLAQYVAACVVDGRKCRGVCMCVCVRVCLRRCAAWQVCCWWRGCGLGRSLEAHGEEGQNAHHGVCARSEIDEATSGRQ